MGPFVVTNNDTKKIMRNLLISIIPIILFAIYKNGLVPFINGKTNLFGMLYPIIVIFVGSFVSFFIEFIYYKLIKRNNNYVNSYGFFPGLFLALILPLNVPFYVLIVGAIIASISKLLFGGFGKNLFNPALVGYLSVMIIFSGVFTTNNYFNGYELDTISASTPLTNASIQMDIGSYKDLVEPYGNLFNFFIGTIPGSFAETSSLLCLIALVYLIFTKTIKWRIPVIYILSVFVITFSIGRLLGQGIYYPMFHLFSGGLLFGAVFMATDPVTSALTPVGQIIQGVVLAILTVVLRFTGVEGVAISIIVTNAVVFVFDKIGLSCRFDFIKLLPYFVGLFIAIVITIFCLASTKRVVDNQDPNFDVLSKETIGNQTIYTVTQKGYGGKIKASITFENDSITDIEILSNNETKDRYQLVIDNDYFDILIENQNDIEAVDTISTATVTTTALKRMVINVLNVHN